MDRHAHQDGRVWGTLSAGCMLPLCVWIADLDAISKQSVSSVSCVCVCSIAYLM